MPHMLWERYGFEIKHMGFHRVTGFHFSMLFLSLIFVSERLGGLVIIL